MSVDTKAKRVTFKDGTNQHYDQLLISTGGRLDYVLKRLISIVLMVRKRLMEHILSHYLNNYLYLSTLCKILQHINMSIVGLCIVSRARPLQCPGAELENVKLLQNYKDATEIQQISSGKRAVIVGTSFIGIQKANKSFYIQHYGK